MMECFDSVFHVNFGVNFSMQHKNNLLSKKKITSRVLVVDKILWQAISYD
jgi:hypothetical protein